MWRDNNPEEGKKIGKKAREDVANLYSYEKIAEIVDARILEIRKKLAPKFLNTKN